jgi:hypothetical protein
MGHVALVYDDVHLLSGNINAKQKNQMLLHAGKVSLRGYPEKTKYMMKSIIFCDLKPWSLLEAH